MKFDGINEVLFDEAYDELLARYSETQEFISPCGASKPKSSAKPKAKPKRPTPPKPPAKPKASKGSQAGPKKKKPCPPKATSRMGGEGDSFSETLDFVTCQRPDGSNYGTSGQCRKGTQVEAPQSSSAKGHEGANAKFMAALQENAGEDTKISTEDDEVVMRTSTKGGTDLKITFSLEEGYNFSVNGSWDAGSVDNRREQVSVALKVKKNFQAVTKSLPTGTVLKTRAWAGDGLEQYQSRVKAYERMGFGPPKSLGGAMFAKKLKSGKISRATELGYNKNKKNEDAVFFAEASEKEDLMNWLVAIFGARVKESQNFSETLDFKTCKRKDGTIYGVPDKSDCVKGIEEHKGKKHDAEVAEKEMVKAAKAILANPTDLESVKKNLAIYTTAMGTANLQSEMVGSNPAKTLKIQFGLKLGSYLGEKIGEAIFSEPEWHDFAQTCQRPDGSTYGTSGQCRKGTPTTKDEEAQIQAALKELKGYKAGYQKTGGDNLQDPGEAAKYADFYAKDKDLSYKAPKETRPEVVKETLARLKEDDPAQYTAVMKSLNSKGSPEKTMKAEAGWKGTERGEAVLKSLMDNDFKDVLGNPAPWGQGLQLDHRTAGSVGGKDLPKNWIWISTASNQTKGGYEAAAKKVKGTGAEKEAFIKASLIKGLQANAKMTPAQVKEVKAKGAATVAAKAEGAAKTRKVLPTMTPAQRGELIAKSSGPQMKEILKASVAEGKNPVTGRPTSYRPVLSGGNGARVRKDYGTVPQMKSLAKMRWDEPLSKSDISNIGGILKASTGSTKSRSERLDELMGNFPRTSGLTAAERIAILGAAE